MFPFPTYTYPDGNKSVNKPKDGQSFVKWDIYGNEIEHWQWDEFLGKWLNVTHGKPADDLSPELQKLADALRYIEPKCDCGSEHVGSPRHSNWCSKYDPKQ